MTKTPFPAIAVIATAIIGTPPSLHAQAPYTDYIGAGHASGITATASSIDETATPLRTVDGSGLSSGNHGGTWDHGWLGFAPAPNPVPGKGSGHWIRYDLGHVYELKTSGIWNSNEPGFTDRGLRSVTIDTSENGSAWSMLGTFELAQASGTAADAGTAGPDFGGVSARYVVITANTNWGAAEYFGLAEIRIEVGDHGGGGGVTPPNPAPTPTAAGGDGIDLDGNGLRDAWERLHGVSNLVPSADDDGDGSTNLQESIAGTDPNDPDSRHRITSLAFAPDLTIAWNAVAGKRYQIRTSTDLAAWTDAGAPVDDASGPTSLVLDGATTDRLFCRIDVSDHDADADGLSAYEEVLLGFSDASPTSSGQSDATSAVVLFSSPGTFTLGGRSVSGATPSLAEASRFLTQATMGANYETIASVAGTGFSAWLDAQFAAPPSYHVQRNVALLSPHPEEPEEPFSPYRWTWWDIAMKGPDVLRQRVAFALSEILVVSDNIDLFEDHPWGLSSYYDILVDGAFGNYEDTLYRVSTHPVMGNYLSHAQNRPTNAALNRFPDENYAREIMQLFSIGLFELNQDGTRKMDAQGNDIPTYDNGTITEFARVFTGMTYDPTPVGMGIPHFEDEFGTTAITNETEFIQVEPIYLNRPMLFFDALHESGPKTLLNGVTIPGGTTEQDVRAAVASIFNHPNVGPFLAHRLIQRLVKSNPSPGYVHRVAAAFNDNGSGVRGDMQSVIRAILLDPEARNRGFLNDPTHGKLREPYLRYVQVMRAFDAGTSSGSFRNYGGIAAAAMKQQPMQAPSVFNFYLPTHQPLGPIADAGLVAPEFQITTSTTTVATMNFWANAIAFDELMDFEVPENVTLDLSDEIALANDVPALVDRLDVLLTRGAMTANTQSILTNTLTSAGASGEELIKFAVYLVTASPDFAVLR